MVWLSTPPAGAAKDGICHLDGDQQGLAWLPVLLAVMDCSNCSVPRKEALMATLMTRGTHLQNLTLCLPQAARRHAPTSNARRTPTPTPSCACGPWSLRQAACSSLFFPRAWAT